ncbi:MAG: AAA family ATPase [Geminicoccaceae bacterium]
MDVGGWLRGLGLEQYVPAFHDAEVTAEILPELTEADLRELGLPLGPRKTVLKAIRDLTARQGPAVFDGMVEPAAILAAPSAPQPERRQLTVMFVDLIGSTELSSRLDPEEMREVLGAYQDAAAGEVARFEGVVAKFMGDGVLAYFGFPQAHEDDAERAVRAGLAILDAVGRLSAPTGSPLAARVGVATGLVVVGDLVGSGAAQERAVVGETPNLAARLQALAAPGAAVIAHGTRQLVGGLFEYADLGVRDLKGFAEPVRAWRVLGPSRAEGRFEALHLGAALTPVIGREHEIAFLLDRWQRAKEGEGQVMLLAGEPGIGKSRVVQVLHQHLGEEAHVRLRYFCSPYRRDSTLHPVIDQLERAAGLDPNDTPERKLDKLEALLARSTEDPGGVAPFVAALLSLPAGTRYPPLTMSPQRQKERTLEALVGQLEGMARRGPVLVVWEDAHWADPTSLEFLGLVIDRVQTIRALVVITFRPEFVPPWGQHAHVTALTLAGLSRRQAAAMVDRLTEGKALPMQVLDQIVGKTDGIPLFVEELTKAVLEIGLLRDEGDRYELTGPLPALAIPATLHDSLMARLDRLARVKEVAQIGAVIGREFSYDLLAAVAPFPEDELPEALAQLCRSQLVFGRGTPPGATYVFKHALVQDAAYGTLLRGRRQHLHARIAGTLEERFPKAATSRPELLAHHFTEAGSAETAIGYWLKAAHLALARSATAEAIAQLNKGLALLDGMDEGTGRRRLELELELQTALGGALIAAKGFAARETGRAWARARELCRETTDSAQLAKVLYGQYVYYQVGGQLEISRQVAEELLRIGRDQGDGFLQLMGYRTVGIAAITVGELREARQHLERALGLCDAARHRVLAVTHTFDPRVAILSYLSWALAGLGHPDQAATCGRDALADARSLAHFSSIAFALFLGSVRCQLLRDRQGAREHAEELISLASEQDFPFWLAGARVVRGWALAHEVCAEEGLAQMREGLATYTATGAGYLLPYFGALLAEAQSPASLEDGVLDEALARAERNGERWFEPELHRLRGELLLRRPDSEGAEACFRRAIGAARGRGMRQWELRASMSLARLWAERGKRDEARELLAPIYRWFTEGFETPDLTEARELLDMLDVDRDATPGS